MKLRSLKLYNKYRSLEPFDFQFLKHPLLYGRIDPMCLVGLNGSGKSNFLELLADIFFEVDKFFLQERKIYTAPKTSTNYFVYADKESKEDIFFEITYEIGEKILTDKTTKEQKKTDGYLIKIERSPNTKKLKFLTQKKVPRIPDLYNYSTTETKFVELNTSDIDACKEFRNRCIPLVIAYTSGLNDLLTLPFIDIQDYYAQQVAKEAFEPTDKGLVIPSPNLLLLNYDSNASIVVSNLLLEEEEKCKIFNDSIRISRLNSFRIVIRLNKLSGSSKVETTEELKDYIQKLQECSATSKIEINDKKGDVYIFDFVVNKVTRELFKLKFKSSQKLFEALTKLNLLNTLCVKSGYRDELKKKRKQGLLLKFPQTGSLDKIFSIEKMELVLTQPNVRTEYEKISDGEHQFVHIVGGILLFDQDSPEKDILYLLDEPDTHFNPLWRSDFFYQLEDVLVRKNVEFIITTHSPFILSDAHGYNVLQFIRNGSKVTFSRVEKETYGATYDNVAENIFKNENSKHYENRMAKLAFNDIEELYKEIDDVITKEDWSEKYENFLIRIRMFGESLDRLYVSKKYAEKDDEFKIN